MSLSTGAMAPLPEHFRRTVLSLYGERGAAWLAALPTLLDECAARWGLTLLPPYPLSYNYVAPVVRSDGSPAVLKVGVPNPELTCEIEALRLCDGQGMVQLLDGDAERGILLLERLEPGTTLRELGDDEQATAIAAEVMAALWCPLPADHPFPTTAKWALGMERLRAH